MRLIFGLALLTLLAACSEQQMCISRATKDLRTVRSFLAETEANIARGYAVVEIQYVDYEYEPCGVNPDDSVKYCFLPEEKTRFDRRAIDIDAEIAKRDVLIAKEALLAKQAELDILACKEAYPEG